MNDELVISDINGVCRLCLRDNGTIIPIFGKENTSRDCIPLSKKILDCLSIKVVNGDGLPGMICVTCVHQLDSWHGFKNICETSQRKLASWLQKNEPEKYKTNEVRVRRQRKTGKVNNSLTSGVIDLSSEDDDVVITYQPVLRRLVGSGQRTQNRTPSHCSQNVDILSIDTNEIEILPLQDGSVCEKEKGLLQQENRSCTSSVLDVPDVITGFDPSLSTTFTSVLDSAKEQILPYAPDNLQDPTPSSSLNTNSKIESVSKESIPENVNMNKGSTESQNIDEGKTVIKIGLPMIETSTVQKPSGTIEHLNTSDKNDEQHKLLNENNSSFSTLYGIGEMPEVVLNSFSKNSSSGTKSTEKGNSQDSDDNCSNIVDSTNTTSNIDSNIQEHADNSLDNSSLVIEQVTSLNNGVGNKSEKDKDQADEINYSCTSWSRLSQNEEVHELQPDMVLCDSPLGVNIKEEPISAGEATGDEEDPLNFQCITFKGEFDDLTNKSMETCNEIEDIKPNIHVLNEVIESQYTPKLLKSGKINCEACRLSFGSYVYYEKHAKSMRHKWNLKLFKSGKAPTRKRGKHLIRDIMGGSYDTNLKGNGPFPCNQCPSVFKHSRNLKTHQKKHLVQGNVLNQEQPELFTSLISPDSEPNIEEPETQNILKNKDTLKCDLCSGIFATYPALLSHKRYCGSSENRVCNYCNQTFTTLNGFFRHRKRCLKLYREERQKRSLQPNIQTASTILPLASVPLDGSVLACTLCNMTFQSSPDLITHMQQNHMDFGQPQTLAQLPNFMKKKSSNVHSNISMRHYCKYCSSSFTSHGALSSHTGYHARRSLYCCKFCKQSHRDKYSFRQHIKVHISDPSLNKNICWICYTQFSSQKDLIDHKTIHSNMKLRIFACFQCGNSYNTRELLGKHKKTAHCDSQTMIGQDQSDTVLGKEPKVVLIDEDNKLFKCRICKKKFTTIGNLKRHNLIHKRPPNVRPIVNIDHIYQNRCSGCHKSFKTQSSLYNHKQVCTGVKKALTNANRVIAGNLSKPLKCTGCKKWFASKNSLYKHKLLKRCRPVQHNQAMVSQLISKKCLNCDQQFLSEDSLDKHKQNCKPSIERLTCDCGEVFSTVELKLAHADTCPANCTCKSCNIKFNSPEELESHKLICIVNEPHSPEKLEPSPSDYRPPSVQCVKCNKSFVYFKCLKMHQDKCLHDRWPCSNCMEIFPTESALATHKSHKTCSSPKFNRSPVVNTLNESPTFKCEYCPKRFTSGIDLNRHSDLCENRPSKRRDNSSIYRPWTCDLCDKSFLWKANLQRHKKLVHKDNSESESHVPKLVSSSSSESSVSFKGESERSYFKCNKCPDIIFHKKQGFLEHQMMHERAEGKNSNDDTKEQETNIAEVMLTCELCDKKLPESLYHMHMDEHMNDDFEDFQSKPIQHESCPETFPCDICGKVFNKKISRKSHRASHYRDGDVLSHLKRESPQKRKLKVRHIRCTVCNKLLSINSIHKHKMMHIREAAEFYGESQSSANNKPVAMASTPQSPTPTFASEPSSVPDTAEIEQESQAVFPCPKCDRSFKLRKSLIEHLKTHSEDSLETESSSSTVGPADQFPYKCLYCDLSWKYKSVQERHLSSKKHLEIQKQLADII